MNKMSINVPDKIQGIPMPNIPISNLQPTSNPDKVVNKSDMDAAICSQNDTDVKKVMLKEISTEQNSNLEQDVSSSAPLLNISTASPTVPKTSVLGIENAKRRLRAFAIQKKGLSTIPLKPGLKGSQLSTIIGKKKVTDSADPANKPKRPPKNRTTRKLLPIPEQLIPGLTEKQLSYAKPELRSVKPELSYVKSDLNYVKPELSYSNLNYNGPFPHYLRPDIDMTDGVDKKRLLVELGVPLGLIDTITTEKRMPTKAMPPIQGLIDHTKVEEFLKEAAEAQKAGKIIKFQYEKQVFHNKISTSSTLDRHRSPRSRGSDYNRRIDRTRGRRREMADRNISARDKNSKEKDRHCRTKNEKKTFAKHRESESDSKEATDMNLEDYLVCDSWSLDTDVKEDDEKSSKHSKSTKNLKNTTRKQTNSEIKKQNEVTVTEKIDKIKAFTEMFSYGIIDTDESDQDEAEYSAVTSISSKTKTSEINDSQLVSEATPEKNDSYKHSSSLEKDLEIKSQDRIVRSQNSELKDISIREVCESQTPEYEYPESEFSHISGDKRKDTICSDLKDAKEEEQVEFDGNDYWLLVMKICQPIMFKHDGDNCSKETKTQPSIVYKESPKHCFCVNDREAVYKEIGARQAVMVQSISSNSSFFNEEDSSSREWYPDVAKSLVCSTIEYATNWETDSSQNSETRHEGRQNLKCPSPNTPQYEPDGSRTFLAQEYEKFMESVWPEIAEDERQMACFDNSSQDLSVYDEKEKLTDKSNDNSLLDEGKGRKMDSDKELITPPKTKKKNKDKKEQTKIKNTSRNKRKLSSSASRSRSSSSDSGSSESSDSSSKSEENNTKKKKITKKTIKTKKAKLKAIRRKKAEKAKLKLKQLKEKQLKKKKEKAKKQKEKEEEEKVEIETAKSKTKATKKREKIKDRKKREKKKKRDVSSSYSSSESEIEVKKTKKKKKAIKRKRMPSSSSPEKTKKKSKKEKKMKQKKVIEDDSNSYSESESDHFDLNVLNNIKAERVSDEEIKEIAEPVIPRPMENLDFSPRRRSNQNINLPAEIISVSELHSEFENLRYKDVQIKQEVINEMEVDQTNGSPTMDSNNESNIESSTVEEEPMETADSKADLNVEIEPEIPKIDTKVYIEKKNPVPKVSSEKPVVFEGLEVEVSQDVLENIGNVEYEYYGGGYDENSCYYGYDNSASEIYDKETTLQLASVSQIESVHTDHYEDGQMDKQMELHQIETVVSNLTSRGEIKCDWRPGQDIVKTEIVEIKRSRWGMETKPCESEIVDTENIDFTKPPPSTTEVYRIPSILDSNKDYFDNQKVYKIETISSSHYRDPAAQYTEVLDFSESVSQDYSEAYRDVYGAADQLQYGDCFAKAEPDEQEDERKRKLSLDDRIHLVLAAQAKSSIPKPETPPVEEPVKEPEQPVPDRGILINLGPDGTRLGKRPIITKRVCFADGYNPGQDSDDEEPPLLQKKHGRRGVVLRRGCAYPCLPGHPDYDSLWDALPPPPPPPGSPPPPSKPAISTQVLRAGRHCTRAEEVSRLITPNLPGDKYAGITRLPKGLGHPE